MKTIDAARLIDIARIISFMVMLVYIAMLFIRFISGFLSACVWYLTIALRAIFNCTYARKRVDNRVAHDRKFALFTGRPLTRYAELRSEADRNCGLADHKNLSLIQQKIYRYHI